MGKSVCVSFDYLFDLSTQLLKDACLNERHARLSAEALCMASLRGMDSHGIRLLPHYLDAIEAGRIDPKAQFKFEQTNPSTGVLDANHGLAHAAVSMATDHAIALARKAGVAFVSVRNSNHCGSMAYYAEKACAEDMIGLAFTNATAKLQVYNSTQPFFGINPICIAAPMDGEEPFCYDAAPSVMSNNKVKMVGARGESLPPHVAADGNGTMTTDPGAAAMLLPLGGRLAGYKGYGMAMLVDILCSLLGGMPNAGQVSAMYEKDGGRMADKRLLAQFVGAIRIDSFEDVVTFKRRLKATADAVRALPRVRPDQEVMVPGDPEKKEKARRLRDGIEVDTSLIENLEKRRH